MEKLIIKDISFKKHEITQTKRYFDNGGDPFYYTIIIKTNIPKGLNPMQKHRDQFFVKGIKDRVLTFYLIGYHIANDEITISTLEQLTSEKKPNIEVYF